MKIQLKILNEINSWLADWKNNEIGNDSNTNPLQEDLCLFVLGGWGINRYIQRKTDDIDIVLNQTRFESIIDYLTDNKGYKVISSPDYTSEHTRKVTLSDQSKNIASIEARFYRDDGVCFSNEEYNIHVDKKWLYYGSDLFVERTEGVFQMVRIPSIFKSIALKIMAIIGRPIIKKKKIIRDFDDVFKLARGLDKYFYEISAVMDQVNLTHHEPMTEFFKRYQIFKEDIKFDINKSILFRFQEYGTIDKKNFIARDKVNSLNWKALTIDEKKYYFDNFIKLKPSHNKPFYPVVSLKRQEELQLDNPIDVAPFNKLLDTFEIDFNLQLTSTSISHSENKNKDMLIADKIRKTIDSQEDITGEQLTVFDSVYNYLSMTEMSKLSTKEMFDVTIVPGCRSDIEKRAIEAYSSYSQQGVKNIFITGMHPYYDDQDIQITEAEAMFYVLTNKEGFDLSNVNVTLETRARNTRENVIHCLPNLQDLYFKLDRPINLLLVTSPYHVRRFYLLVKRSLKGFEEIINNIGVRPSRSYFEKRTWYLSSPTNKFSVNYGLRLYIQEYMKLIGGRATGEF